MSAVGGYGSSSTVAAAVPFDNSTNGFVATDVQAAIEEATFHLTSHEITATGTITTTSSTDAVMTSMTETPPAGTWLYMFNCDVISNNFNQTLSFSFYLAAVQIAVTKRQLIPYDGGTLGGTTARDIVQLQSIITTTGSQVVDVRWSSTAGTGTSSNRSLIRLRLA